MTHAPADWTFGATIPAKDLDGTRKFYEDVLGLELIREDPAGITYRAGDAIVFLYPTEFAGARSDAELAAAYDCFEVVNRELKALVTSWQTMTVGGQSMPNDHSDADYDARVIGRLGDLHERAERVIEALAKRVPRLGRYKERLAAALERAEAGETEWVSGVRCDSYHMVWFEMHEDLLRLLGRKREE